MKKIHKLLLIVFLSLSITGCFNDDIDDNPATNAEINDFVWKALNLWYFWQQDVDDLSDTRFSSNEDYSNYLNSFDSPEALFETVLFNEDRFSVIVDDYTALINSLSGVSKTNGMEFGLARINGGAELLGYVQYVLPNTDAETKNVIRGNLFRSVNGTNLTEDNFRDLLFSDSDSYTIGLADIINNEIVVNGSEITLNKQVYTENPIFKTEVFNVEGITIGYLMYNSFNDDFDTQLNNAFADFAAQGVEELVLDLRYNLGGSVGTSIRLSSMITGQYTGDVFLKSRYNDKQNPTESQELPFVNQLADGSSINSLNLNSLYVLAQGSSASASELLINSLSASPYLANNLVHIGGTTVGKNEFSSLLLDVPDCDYRVTLNCDGIINPRHNYGILPLLGFNENADGFFDFTAGINPDIEFPEDLSNLGVLGTETEPLLERAIQEITGSGRAFIPSVSSEQFKTIANSKEFRPIRNTMIMDVPIPFSEN